MFGSHMPDLVVHADWGVNPVKRWMITAYLNKNGYYSASSPEPVGEPETLLTRLYQKAGVNRIVFIGFDFPIGLPQRYAENVGISDFLAILPKLGQGEWAKFYQVAEQNTEISYYRPFYPYRPGGTKHTHLFNKLKVSSIDDLRRCCEKKNNTRGAACPLFWTLGAQQVGKGAIIGWRDVLGPALRNKDNLVKIWPFDGSLAELLKPDRIVIAETYPAEFYRHLGIVFPQGSGKRNQMSRQAVGLKLLDTINELKIKAEPSLVDQIKDGFGPEQNGEDPFDATIGLIGMLNVLRGKRVEGKIENNVVNKIEGWILGQTEIP